MQLLYLVHQFLPEYNSGTEHFTYNLARGMQRAGHRVEILTCSLAEGCGDAWEQLPGSPLRRTIVDGIPVTAIPRKLLGSFADLGFADPPAAAQSAFEAFLIDRKFDVCHVAHPMRMAGALNAIRRSRLPYIVTLTDFFFICYRINLFRVDGHNCSGPASGQRCVQFCNIPPWDDTKLAQNRNRAVDILMNAASVVACSEFVASVFNEELAELDIRVQRHGIDLSRFAPTLREELVQRDLGKPLTFGYIGTISELKGVLLLARAFVAVRNPEIRLRIIGPSYDHLDAYKQLRLLAGEDARISVEPAVSSEQIPALLQSFDLLCMPSIVPEAGSLSLQEGFAANLPALVSDLGFQSYVVRREGCGLSVAAGDCVAWSKAIRDIADHPEILTAWRFRTPLPVRVEEEAFFYEALYRHAAQTPTQE